MLKYCLPICMMWLCPAVADAVDGPPDIFKPNVSDTVTYNDNLLLRSGKPLENKVYPLPSGMVKGDVINQATVGSMINYTLGHHRFNLNLNVTDNQFANNHILNHISSTDLVVWDWMLGKQFSGDVGYNYSREMGGFSNTSFYGLDIITGNNVFAHINYAWHPRWKIQTGFNWQSYVHSATQRMTLNQDTTTALTSLNYMTPSSNSIGMQYSLTYGKYPNPEMVNNIAIADKYQQHDIRALLLWKLTEKSSFKGDAGYVIRQYPDYSQRDFSGQTFNLKFSWTPTAKTMLELAGWRQLNSYPDVTTTYVIAEGFSLSPMWNLLPKLTLSAKFSRQTLDYTVDTAGIVPRHDILLRGGASLVYTPVTNCEVTLGYQAGTRDSNILFYDYNFNSVFSTVMLKF